MLGQPIDRPSDPLNYPQTGTYTSTLPAPGSFLDWLTTSTWGIPRWGLLAGGVVGVLLLSGGGASRRRNPGLLRIFSGGRADVHHGRFGSYRKAASRARRLQRRDRSAEFLIRGKKGERYVGPRR